MILRGVSGYAESGELLAIMGPSGAGKSSLLNVLAGRVAGAVIQDGDQQGAGPLCGLGCDGGGGGVGGGGAEGYHLHGSILLNGRPPTRVILNHVAAYVPQDDVLLDALTARETVRFSAQLRLPAALSDQEKNARAERVLQQLGLTRCADTRIGSVLTPGLSGGEKRRVSIGVELVRDPHLLFVDEPTSGLDSSTAFTIVALLRTLARQGRTVVVSIHSPSSRIFALFDRVLLLARGALVFLGSPVEAEQHFSSLGFHVPPLANPAEAYLAILHGRTMATEKASERERPSESESVRAERLAAAFSGSEVAVRAAQRLERERGQLPDLGLAAAAAQSAGGLVGACSDRVSWSQQLRVLSHRATLHYTRDPLHCLAGFAQNVFLSCFLGAIFWQLGAHQDSINARVGAIFFSIAMQAFTTIMHAVMLVSDERPVLGRERAAGLYRLSAYFVAKSLVEVPVQVVLALTFAAPCYYMIGLQPSFGPFVRWLLCVVLICGASHSIGLLLGALVPNALVAVTVSPVAMIPCLLVTGFFLNLHSVPIYLDWLVRIAPHHYIFRAMMVNEFSGLVLDCDDGRGVVLAPDGTELCPVTRGEQVLSALSIPAASSADFWWPLACTLGLFVGFRVCAYLALRFTTAAAARAKNA